MYSPESMLLLTLWGCHLLLKPLLTDISLILKVSFSFSLSAILEVVKSPQYHIFDSKSRASFASEDSLDDKNSPFIQTGWDPIILGSLRKENYHQSV